MINMCVVPIKVTHVETKREVSAFAILDNCSQGCFIERNIRKRHGASDRNNYQNIK